MGSPSRIGSRCATSLESQFLSRRCGTPVRMNNTPLYGGTTARSLYVFVSKMCGPPFEWWLVYENLLLCVLLAIVYSVTCACACTYLRACLASMCVRACIMGCVRACVYSNLCHTVLISTGKLSNMFVFIHTALCMRFFLCAYVHACFLFTCVFLDLVCT